MICLLRLSVYLRLTVSHLVAVDHLPPPSTRLSLSQTPVTVMAPSSHTSKLPEHLGRLVTELNNIVKLRSVDFGTRTDGTIREISERASQTEWQRIPL